MSEVTPPSCKGALGTWQLQEYPDNVGPENHGAPVEANQRVKGWMWVSTEASRALGRRPSGGQGQNRTGESPPSGIAGGPAETWTMVELGTQLAYRKSECWKLSTYSRARRRSIPTELGPSNSPKFLLRRQPMAEIISVHLILSDPAQFSRVTAQCTALNLKVLSQRPDRSVAVAGDRDIIQGMLSQTLVTTQRRVAVGRSSSISTEYIAPEATRITEAALQPLVSELTFPV